MSFRKDYFTFANHISRHQYSLTCPRCPLQGTPRIMQKHLPSHCPSQSTSCPWCLGDYSWPVNRKMHHLDHIKKCYDTFVKEHLTIDARTRKNLSHIAGFQKTFWTLTVHSCETPLQCSRCPLTMPPKDFEQHYKTVHNVNVRELCVFCDGQYRGKDVHHLRKCFREKVLHQSTHPKPVPSFTIHDTACPERHLFGRDLLFEPEDYQDLHDDSHWYDCMGNANQLQFRGHVETARLCLSMYMHHPTIQHWYHIMVRGIAMPKFRQVMHDYMNPPEDAPLMDEAYATAKNTFVLPFWCWCDGGQYDNKARHHRHMILATDNPLFMQKEWKKVVLSNEEKLTKKCKDSKKITSAWHLVNTLHYVSNRRSRCKFSFDTAEGDPVAKLHHYYIARSLPQSFKFCMSTLLPDGFRNVLNERFGRLSAATLMPHALQGDQNQWFVPVQHLLALVPQKSFLLPVARHLKPDPHASGGDAFANTLNGKKLFFVQDDTRLTEPEWNLAQREGGNVFLDCLRSEPWPVVPSQKKDLNLLSRYTEPFKLSIANLQQEKKNLKQKYRHSRQEIRRWQQKYSHLQLAYGHLQEKLSTAQDDNCQLRQKIMNLQNDEIIRLRKELDETRRENKILQNELSILRNENNNLKNELNILKNELYMLKNENNDLKKRKYCS